VLTDAKLIRRDGPDGPWASFSMNVRGRESNGSDFRIFPATSLPVLLLPVAADFCNGSHVLDEPCASRNIVGFNSSSMISAYEGDKNVLPVLGLSPFMAGDTWATEAQPYGLTNVGMSSVSKQSVTLKNQWVLGMASKTFPLGLFGLSNSILKFDSGSTRPFIEAFRETDSLNATALSFSYTAGSYKRNVAPSLILGGYDSTRFDPQTTLEVAILQPFTASLGVNLTKLSFTGSDKVWRDSDVDSLGLVTVAIDSAIPHIWLPLSACKVFEEVFGLEWDETTQLYLINATAHDRLQRLNTTVTFSLQSTRHGSKAMDFSVPYTAFDMKVTYPLVEKEGYYFPLKRASSPNQYTLGRTFLQETYLSVNYDTASFNISQATYTEGTIAVQPFLRSAPAPVITGTLLEASTTSRLSPGAYAAIGLGVGSLILLIAIFIFAWNQKIWPFEKPALAQNTHDEQDQYWKGEVDRLRLVLVEAMDREVGELEVKEPIIEIGNPNNLHELDADSSPRTPIEEIAKEDARAICENEMSQTGFKEVKW
jgi:hypothetical protein